MNDKRLEAIANSLVEDGKGILAADESHRTIKKRFDSIGIASTAESRRSYREMLFTTDGLENYISGVILFDETLRQSTGDGVAFPELLSRKGVIPGIKADTGLKPMALHPGEQITEGLDGLKERIEEYSSMGARFAKWRAVISIGEGLPTFRCIESNAYTLAQYSAICQEAGMVPIVEPEVLMAGDHSIERCEEVTTDTLRIVFSELLVHRVQLEGVLLKPNMVLPGDQCADQRSVEEVAEATVRCLRRTVPGAVSGVVFLSGGQSPGLSTAHLNEMNKRGVFPWKLSFSYGRALQEPALKAWAGENGNASVAQRVLCHRAKCNSAATYGRFSESQEAVPA